MTAVATGFVVASAHGAGANMRNTEESARSHRQPALEVRILWAGWGISRRLADQTRSDELYGEHSRWRALLQ